jgi:hypothetical protein
LDEPNYGVLKPETIAGWDQLVGNYADGQLGEGISGSFGIGAEFVELTNTDLKTAENDLAKQKAELEKITKDIAAIEEVIRTKNGFVYGKAAAPTTVTINGNVYSYSSKLYTYVLGNNNTKGGFLINLLRDTINSLNARKKGLENAITQSISSVNNAKSASKPPIDLNALKNLLPPKIPKIPKLPDIPKIPKLPSLDSLGGMIIAALPALPALPKLSLPKFPSFKFPKLPKFKKKEPNEPKKYKIKKKKGLAGLQDAASSAQGAVAGAQSAAAGAVSSAKGAVAGAQSAAAGVVANAQSVAMNTVGNINAGMITNVTNVGGGTLTTTTITSAILGKGETEASILADIAKSAAEVAARIKK